MYNKPRLRIVGQSLGDKWKLNDIDPSQFSFLYFVPSEAGVFVYFLSCFVIFVFPDEPRL